MSHLFELVFANGGYAVFRLKPPSQASKAPKIEKRRVPKLPSPEDEEPSASSVKTMLGQADTWAAYIKRCAKEQPDCGARLMELAATWHHSMKRPEVAEMLRKTALKRFPDDGFVHYYYGRHLDYEVKGAGRETGEHYKEAVKKFPNNAIIVREYIMYLDMVAQDTGAVKKLLQARQEESTKNGKKDRPTALLALKGVGAPGLLCEAAVSARSLGMEAFGDAMWKRALQQAPFSDCIKNNWGLIHEGSNFTGTRTVWDQVGLLLAGGVQHDVAGHNEPSVRFIGEPPLLMNPFSVPAASA
jgi:tetratricopeptide (TPR) repeat protein